MKLTIRKIKEHGNVRFKLDFTPIGGTRQRRFFKTRAEAEAAADEQRQIARRHGEDWLALSVAARADLITGYHRLQDLGLTLNQLIDQWQTGARIKSNGQHKTLTLAKASDAWEAFMRSKGNSKMHCANCGRWVRRFATGREEMPVDQVTTDHIVQWLSNYDGVSYNGNRDYARSFFGWAHDNGFHPESIFDGKRIPKKKIVRDGAVIFTVDQVKRGLEYCLESAPELLAYFVIATFAGLRPTEVDRLEWSDVDLEHGLIHLPASKTKTRRTRLVHLHPTAKAWIAKARALGSDPCLPQKQAQLVPLRNHLGFSAWPSDIMRHTFGSYHVAMGRDVGATALEMGNSPQIIMAHYFNVVKPEACEAFWALTPATLIKA